MNTRINLLLVTALSAIPTVATAIPAPMSPADLEAKSDVIVDAEVIAVACVGTPKGTALATSTFYRSTLSTQKAYKGNPPKQFFIDFTTVKWKGPPPIGGWKEAKHLVGEAGKYHLQLKKSPDVYGSTWHNALSKTADGSGTLPDCTGGSGGADAGSTATDSGSSAADAGATKEDAATPAQDSGATAADTGTPTQPDTTSPSEDVTSSDTATTGAKDVASSADTSTGSTADTKPAPAPSKTDDGGCQASAQPNQSPLSVWILAMLALTLLLRRRRAAC